jgi:glycosyltransferase involved in cell wall biosynthesis
VRLVSVIIPTYNRAPVLGRAVESVLAQSLPSFELIVVDDGSSDGTTDVVSQFGDRVKLIRQENRGASSARNAGIRASRGELIAFLDSDDEWLPSKLEKQAALFSDGDFICHTEEIWYRNGKQVPQKKIHRKQGGRFFQRALERCLISPSSVMISRSLLDRVGWFDEDLPAAEDYDLWLRITAFHEVAFVPEPLVIKHGGCANQLSETTPAIDRYRIRAIEKILAAPDLSAELRKAARRELVRKCGIVAAGCEKRGKMQEAEAYRELARSHDHIDSSPPGCEPHRLHV